MGELPRKGDREYRTRAARSWWIGLVLGIGMLCWATSVLLSSGEVRPRLVVGGGILVAAALAMRRLPPYVALRAEELEIRVGRRKAVLPLGQLASLKEGRLSLVLRLRDGTAYPVSLWRLRAKDRVELVLALRRIVPEA